MRGDYTQYRVELEEGMGKHNICNQLKYAVHKSKAFGESKFDERKKGQESRTNYKTYSRSSMKEKLDIAKSLGKWIQQEHPEIKRAVEITPQLCQDYLSDMAAHGVRQTTLEKATSTVRAVMRCVESSFGSPRYDLKGAIKTPPISLEAQELRTAKGMSQKDFKKLLGSIKPTSNTAKAMILARTTGARVGGACAVKKEDIRIDGDKAYVTLKDTGGRSREVEVVRKEHVEALCELRGGAKDGEYIIRHRGRPIKPESVEKGVQRAMAKVELSRDYKYEKMHPIRKLWAMERYNDYRQDLSKLDTVRYINIQLGHGAERDEALLGRYVDEMR